jgi:hypothetical protein
MIRRQVAITRYGEQYGCNYRERRWFLWSDWSELIVQRLFTANGHRAYTWGTLEEANRVSDDAIRNGVINAGEYKMPIYVMHDDSDSP